MGISRNVTHIPSETTGAKDINDSTVPHFNRMTIMNDKISFTYDSSQENHGICNELKIMVTILQNRSQ